MEEESEAGYQIDFDQINSYTDYANIVITNLEGNTLHFDALGRLIEIRGPKQKVISKIRYNNAGKILSEKVYESWADSRDGVEPAGSAQYTYDSGNNVKEIESGKKTYSFDYTQFGELREIKLGNQKLVSYEYKSNSNRILSKIIYGNETGDGKNTIAYTYNSKNQLTDDGQAAYTYQKNGEIESVQDRGTGITTTWTDNKCTAVKSGTLYYEYEAKGKTSSFRNQQGTQTLTEQKVSSYLNELVVAFNNTSVFKQSQTTDRLGHMVSDTISKADGSNTALLKKAYEYRMIDSARVTDQISKVTTTVGGTTESEAFTYNLVGNIASITDQSGNETSYVYDRKDQLIRENNKSRNRTIIYTYDKDGNMTKKQEYAYTKSTVGTVLSEKNYTYGNSTWGDLLTNYNGQTIQYDSIGNPTQYCGRQLSWEKGRQLASGTKSGVTTTYQYDENGLRTKKTVGSETYEYTYVDGMLHAMKSNGLEMMFSYDNNGNPLSVWYNGSKYLYQTNLQGDVVGILNQSGTKVATYTYDTYGNLLNTPSAGIGTLNPLRYRGYVYDTDTQFYYVTSRYYDPEIGRFLNADEPSMLLQDQGNLLQYNLYAYCYNNPVMYKDSTGYWGFSWTRAINLARGIALILTGLWAIIKFGQVGLVKAGMSSFLAKGLVYLAKLGISLLGLQQYITAICYIIVIVSTAWQFKKIIANIPLGVNYIKKAFA